LAQVVEACVRVCVRMRIRMSVRERVCGVCGGLR